MIALIAKLKTIGSCKLLSLFLLLILRRIHGQPPVSPRKFPPLFNAAEERPLKTEPSQASCGIPDRVAYCQASKSVSSIEVCRQNFCEQDCPRRTSLPQDYIHMLEGSGYGSFCVRSDSVNRRPGAAEKETAAVFENGPLCFLTPFRTPVVGANGAFTITLWIWQSPGNVG